MVSDRISYLNQKGIQAVRQTVYSDLDALIDANTDIVVMKSTQNRYFIFRGELDLLGDFDASVFFRAAGGRDQRGSQYGRSSILIPGKADMRIRR